MDIVWKYTEPLEDGALDSFTAACSYEIPQELRQLIEAHNGGYPDKNVFDVPQEGMVFSHLLSFNKNSSESVYLFLDDFLENGTLRALPFATDGFGNLLCEKAGKICYWNHETEEIVPVAGAVSALLELLHD